MERGGGQGRCIWGGEWIGKGSGLLGSRSIGGGDIWVSCPFAVGVSRYLLSSFSMHIPSMHTAVLPNSSLSLRSYTSWTPVTDRIIILPIFHHCAC